MRGAVIGSFMGCQRGKRDIAIDLKQPDGVRLALELVATADIVHHNMTLGTAERLGVGYEAVPGGQARHLVLQHLHVRA